jgi:hypothetical protein
MIRSIKEKTALKQRIFLKSSLSKFMPRLLTGSFPKEKTIWNKITSPHVYAMHV